MAGINKDTTTIVHDEDSNIVHFAWEDGGKIHQAKLPVELIWFYMWRFGDWDRIDR